MKLITWRWNVLMIVAAYTMQGAAAFSQELPNRETTASKVMAKRVDLNLENADIRHALKLLFQSAGANYTIDPAVQGTVTASLTDVPLRKALESLLKTVASTTPLTYRVEEDVFHVSLRKDSTPEAEPPGEPEPTVEKKRNRLAKIQLNFLDPADLANLLGGTLIQTRFGSVALMGFGNSGLGQTGGGQGQSGNGGLGNGSSGFGQFGNGGAGQFGNGSGFNGSSGNFGSGNSGSGNFGSGNFGSGNSGAGNLGRGAGNGRGR